MIFVGFITQIANPCYQLASGPIHWNFSEVLFLTSDGKLPHRSLEYKLFTVNVAKTIAAERNIPRLPEISRAGSILLRLKPLSLLSI